MIDATEHAIIRRILETLDDQKRLSTYMLDENLSPIAVAAIPDDVRVINSQLTEYLDNLDGGLSKKPAPALRIIGGGKVINRTGNILTVTVRADAAPGLMNLWAGGGFVPIFKSMDTRLAPRRITNMQGQTVVCEGDMVTTAFMRYDVDLRRKTVARADASQHLRVVCRALLAAALERREFQTEDIAAETAGFAARDADATLN
jgi:hypothetical protein